MTDPLFRERVKFVKDLSISPKRDIFMCSVRSESDDHIKSLLPKLDRDTRPNFKLFHKKMKGVIPFNETFIRFSWHEETCSAPSSKIFDARFPEVTNIVHDIMGKPMALDGAYPLSGWDPKFQKACIDGTAGPATARCSLDLCLSK